MFFLVGVVINQFSTIPDENNAVLTLMCITVIGQEDPRWVASTIDGEASPNVTENALTISREDHAASYNNF